MLSACVIYGNYCAAIVILLPLLLIITLSGIEAVLAYNVTYVDLPAVPTDIDFNEIDGTAYVVTPGNGSIQVLDGQNNTIIDTVRISSPIHAAYDKNDGNVYVSACISGRECSVHVMDGQNNTVTDRIPIPSQVGPFVPTFRDITSDPNDGDIYLLESPFSVEDFMAQGAVHIIDNTNKTVIRTVETGFGDDPSNLVFNSNNSKAYVLNQGFGPMSGARGTLSIIDGLSDTLESTVPVGVLPFVIGSNPTFGKTYVGNQESKTVSVIDGQSDTVIKTIDVDGIPTDITFDPNNNNMYLTSGFPNSTTVIDGKNDTAIKTIPLEGIPEAIAFDPSNGRMLVTLNVHPGAISVIDDKTNAVIENIPLKMETLKIDLNPINGNLYVRNAMDRTIGIVEPG